MAHRIVAAYYWLTPLFWAADVLFGANVRAGALEGSPSGKTLYYLFCLACAAAITARPALASLVGLAEASVQVLLLVLGVFVPYYQLADQLAAGETPPAPIPFGPAQVTSFLLASVIWTVSFRLHARRLGTNKPFPFLHFRA